MQIGRSHRYTHCPAEMAVIESSLWKLIPSVHAVFLPSGLLRALVVGSLFGEGERGLLCLLQSGLRESGFSLGQPTNSIVRLTLFWTVYRLVSLCLLYYVCCP